MASPGHEESMAYGDDKKLAVGAEKATRQEHEMTVWQSIVKYRKALFWALFISLTNVLAGYDIQVCGNLLAVPAFQNDYGYEYDPVDHPSSFIISTPWQVALGTGVISAQMVGALFGGPLADTFGRKIPIYGLLLGNICFVLLEMFANGLGMLFAGQFLNGVCYSFYFVLAPTYAAEVVPNKLRNVSIGFQNMAMLAGALLGQGVTTATQDFESSWAYKAPFATQYFWVLIILLLLWKCPESPWWLIHKGRVADARKALEQLAIADDPEELDNVISMMKKTDRLEIETANNTNYKDCFTGANLRRTEIAALPYTLQFMTSIFFGQLTYFLTLSGLGTKNSFLCGVGAYALGYVMNLIYYWTSTFIGRRALFMWGSFVLGGLLLIIGFLDIAPAYDSNPGFSWAQAVLLIQCYGIYMGTTAPASWVIMSESSSSRLRSKTVGLTVALTEIIYIPTAVGIPYEINPDQLNWRGKTGFLYAGFAFISFVWAFLRLPEMKGRTFEELDIMFELRVPARQFKNYVLDTSIVSVPKDEETAKQSDKAAEISEKAV